MLRRRHWVLLRAVSPAIKHASTLPGRVTKNALGVWVPTATQKDRCLYVCLVCLVCEYVEYTPRPHVT